MHNYRRRTLSMELGLYSSKMASLSNDPHPWTPLHRHPSLSPAIAIANRQRTPFACPPRPDQAYFRFERAKAVKPSPTQPQRIRKSPALHFPLTSHFPFLPFSPLSLLVPLSPLLSLYSLDTPLFTLLCPSHTLHCPSSFSKNKFIVYKNNRQK